MNWLTQGSRNADAAVLEISGVDLPAVGEGGERERLIEFAKQVNSSPAQILIFADADFDRILKRQLPNNVILTDFRDLEGYVLTKDCIDKAAKVGVSSERISAEHLLGQVIALGRELAIIRLCSSLHNLRFSFQKTRLGNFIFVNSDGLQVRRDGYLKALLQNSGLSLKELPTVEQQIRATGALYPGTADLELIHGKDAFRLIDEAFRALGLAKDVGGRLMWCSFERDFAKNHQNLMKVIQFLT